MKKFFKALLKWETVAGIFMIGSIVTIIFSENVFEFGWIFAGLCVLMLGINELRHGKMDIDINLTKSDLQDLGSDPTMMSREEIEGLIDFTMGFSNFVKNDLSDTESETTKEIRDEILRDNALIIATLETVLEGMKK